jgi:hypothetical protein
MNKHPVTVGAHKPPALIRPEKWLKHFYRFVDDLDYLIEHYEWLQTTRGIIMGGGSIPEIDAVKRRHEQYESTIAACLEGMRRYDRDGDDDERYDDQDGDLSFGHVVQTLSQMLDWGWTSHSKKFDAYEDPEEAAAQWLRTLVEFVLARQPSAVELESTCLKLIEGDKPFSPETQEVLRMLRAEQKAWAPRKHAIDNVQSAYHQLLDVIPKAKAAAEKRKADEEAAAAQWKAESEAATARRNAEAEAETARKKDEAEKRRIEIEAALARRKAEEEAEFWRDLERREAKQIAEAHAWGCEYLSRFPAMPLEEQLENSRTIYLVYPSIELMELGASVAESCAISFALGLFEERRAQRAWCQEAPAALPAPRRARSQRGRKFDQPVNKLAAASKHGREVL